MVERWTVPAGAGLIGALVLLAVAASAEETSPLAAPVVTGHTLELADGTDLAYEATVGYVALGDDAANPDARILTVAYTVAEAERPVTFLVNGGPGAASAYLHVGGLGPRVLATDDRGLPAHRPARLEDNPHTWLAFTDLVFVDPPGTGFSRAMGVDQDDYLEPDADLAMLAAVVDLWLDAAGRRGDAVYLAGESYGGYRAAALPARLMRDAGIGVRGTILVSPVIDFATIRHHAFRPLSWAFLLPAYAASAEALGRQGEGALAGAEVHAFALGDYLEALVHPAARLESVLDRLVATTGIEADLWRKGNGRLPVATFRREILADEGRIVSAYDGGVHVADPRPTSAFPTVDPILDGLTAPLTTVMLEHLRTGLGWSEGRGYRLLSREVNRAWRWGSERRQGYLSAANDLGDALALDEGFEIWAVHGAADLVTPYLASAWLLDQIGAVAGPDRVRTTVHEGGHMFYMRPDAAAAVAVEARGFYAR